MKPKKIKGSYGNKMPKEFQEKYLNVWTCNKTPKNKTLMVSLLINAEGGSLIQLVVSPDGIYNGIYQLITYKTNDVNGFSYIYVDDLDVLHDPKNDSLEDLINQLLEINKKYKVFITNEVIEELKKDPFGEVDNLPILGIE